MVCEKDIGSIKDIELTFTKSDNCVVDCSIKILRNAFEEICGKSVFCREGIIQLLAIISDITEGRGSSEDIDTIIDLCITMVEITDCELSREIARSILNSLNSFRDEWEEHVNKKLCPSLICNKLVTFHILGEKCNGCTQCIDKCPVNAISGEKDMIHVIDQDECNKCGLCFDICADICGAIVKAGRVKPKTPKEPIPVGTWQAKSLGLRKGLRKRK